jgi:2,3-bisphosphoglycerate-independent phosphoglycerate mutase
MSEAKQKALLLILDGWGLNQAYPGNAITLAQTPFFDALWNEHPTAVLEASGESVGLPEGQMGTSEVNHFTIGAGRIIFQDLVRVNKAIDDDSFYTNPAFMSAFAHTKAHASSLHILGLVSDGGVHSQLTHIIALLEAAKRAAVARVYVHVITDGRDTSPEGGARYTQELESAIEQIGIGKIASVSGRYYAMDRDKNWDRTDQAFTLLTEGKGEEFSSIEKAIQASYHAGVTDEFIKPAAITPASGESHLLQENDALIFANFRNDRPRQLTERLLQQGPSNLKLVTMTKYHPLYPVEVAFPPDVVGISLGQVLSERGYRQLRTTETEKKPHMTFFINCKHEEPFEGEDHQMFDSYSDIPTHDHRPSMRANDIAQAIVTDIEQAAHDVIFANLCNADMVGHTGNIPAAVEGCQAVDQALAKIIPVAQQHNFHIIITADHGNADEMLDQETGEPVTSHSLNPVPLIVISPHCSQLKRSSGQLKDIAPTILTLLQEEVPHDMSGESFV